MFPRRDRTIRARLARRAAIAAALLLACAAAPSAAAAPADEVAAYLERHGLVELLAVHLEDELARATGDRRTELLVRLAALYAQLLETVDDPARRVDLDERSRRLLAEAPPGSAHELRLALLRVQYRTAERLAERHRLRAASDEDVARAKETLAELLPELRALEDRTKEHAEQADDRLGRSGGGDAIVRREEADQAVEVQRQAQFLGAWATYYDAWINERKDRARGAERTFADLLDFVDQVPVPEQVSVDLRSNEAIARCILGMALCKSLTSSSATALSWLVLLESDRTFGPVRRQVPVWRMAILLEHGEFIAVQAEFDRLAAAGTTIPNEWLRLAAVYAIEAGAGSRHAEALASFAVTTLAARGELEQVFDLAQRYGARAIGESGFAFAYVSGVLRYRAARAAHGNDSPASPPAATAFYDEAIALFEQALDEPDVERYVDSRADCIRLIAWSAYFKGALRFAYEHFASAADELPPEMASEALWMAIVCLDRMVEADGRGGALDTALAATIDRFLGRYPSSEHAPKLVLRLALATEEASPELLEDLLAVPANSDVYLPAQRRAGQILYKMFRDGEGPQRVAHGNRYLAVVGALQTRDAEVLDLADELAMQRYVVRGRRLLEVSLHDDINRPAAARAVLRSFDELAEQGVNFGEIAAEVDYRRLKERLLSNDAAAASRIADAAWEDDPDGLWARLGVRAMFRHGRRAWREAGRNREDERAAVALVLRHGLRAIEEYRGDPAALEHPGVLVQHAAVAEALLTAWERGDPARGRQALEIYDRLLAARPQNASFLRATARLTAGLGPVERSIECWRRLVAGTRQGTDEWFEAKFNLINLLARTDPERARAVVEQHRLINPDYGPDPWGARLRALYLRLRVETDDDAPAAPGSDDGASGAGGDA